MISAGFGFTKAIERLGIERRVHTSGASKGILDPFQAERPDDVERLKAIQRDVHDVFIGIVKERRAGRLKGLDGELFSGAFWSAPKALELGLIDGITDVRTKMRELHGPKVKLTQRAALRRRAVRAPAAAAVDRARAGGCRARGSCNRRRSGVRYRGPGAVVAVRAMRSQTTASSLGERGGDGAARGDVVLVGGRVDVGGRRRGSERTRAGSARGKGEETMPQLVALILVGAGLYAGFRWLTLELRRHAEEAARVSEEVRSRAAAAARNAQGPARSSGTRRPASTARAPRPRTSPAAEPGSMPRSQAGRASPRRDPRRRRGERSPSSSEDPARRGVAAASGNAGGLCLRRKARGCTAAVMNARALASFILERFSAASLLLSWSGLSDHPAIRGRRRPLS